MRYLISLFLPALLSIVLSGCLAAAVGGAGAMAESNEDIDYYLKRNAVDSTTAEAMRSRRIVEGMTKAEVRLVMGAKTDYSAQPTRIENGGTVWVYESSDPLMQLTHRITFTDGTVSEHVAE